MSSELSHHAYYRLPWTLADNAITWLEPTTRCNLYCEGCYRENDPHGHKPLETVIAELEVVKRLRNTDGISIAGGEPLIYPHIVDLVRYIAAQGWKPIINSNGQELTAGLLTDLRDAGLTGMTFHVDSHQVRPGWQGRTEAELNELRLKLATLVHDVGRGRIACAFNATIYRDTLDEVPMLARWAQQHMDIVHSMVFILFRSARKRGGLNAYVRGRRVDVGRLVYRLEHQEDHHDIVAHEAVDALRTAYPDYAPCAYLNGTEDPASLKWLLGLRFGHADRVYGYADRRFIEWVQTAHHFIRGTYLAYTRPWVLRHGWTLLPLAVANRGLRRIVWQRLRQPKEWFAPLRLQSTMIIQPCDILPDGRQNMCDGCPDAVPYDGRLVWSCRLEELKEFGAFVTFAPRTKRASATAKAPIPTAAEGDASPLLEDADTARRDER